MSRGTLVLPVAGTELGRDEGIMYASMLDGMSHTFHIF